MWDQGLGNSLGSGVLEVCVSCVARAVVCIQGAGNSLSNWVLKVCQLWD